MSRTEPAVAVINSSEDTVEMLRACLQQNGFTSVVTAHVTDIRSGKLDFLKFLDQHDPAVFVYDISIPYEENWRFLQLLTTSEEMAGRKVIVTTTNKRLLDKLVGQDTGAHEIVGKPYDLQAIVDAVKRAAGVRRGQTGEPVSH